MKEKDIRTKELNLLMCKMKLTDDHRVLLEIKNGKRTESIPLDYFLQVVNEFAESC